MADEFIDFYQALDLPLEADGKQIRSRIGEVYLEAQRNLDHRNFQTRVRYQELFEVVLPRARYILLDDGRRREYDGFVRAFRGIPANPAPVTSAPAPSESTDLGAAPPDAAPATPAFGLGDASGFRLAEEQPGSASANGKAPRVEGLPASSTGAAQSAQDRDEMLQKWRERLEAAIARDAQEQQQEQAARAPSPGAPNTSSAKPRPPRAPAPAVSFDFGGGNAAHQSEGDREIEEEAKQRQAAQATERQRTERKREAIKEILMGVGVKAVIIGGMAAAFPLGGLLIYLMGLYYPRGAAPKLGLPSTVAWFVGVSIIAVASYFAAHYLSREMRRKKATELSMLSLEDLLRQLGRSY